MGETRLSDGLARRSWSSLWRYGGTVSAWPCVLFGTACGAAFGMLRGLQFGRRRRSSGLAATAETMTSTAGLASLEKLGAQSEQSWVQQLVEDPETSASAPNRQPREVRSGHYVRVSPTPLPGPELIIHSIAVAKLLGIPEEEVRTDAFTAFFSGDSSRVEALPSWCTPYALAIMGRRMVSNCPFGNGNGYGDGRAISVGEVVVDGQRWEMQLKGAGRTPFCRGGDGRAVLRSSIREFLASEAMYALGVDTTRALSLVLSGSETVQRPWYSGRTDLFGGMIRDPDHMITEKCAITTRVSPSFLRIGHVDLFGRRAGQKGATEEDLVEFKKIVEHALFREYPDVAPGQPLPDRAVAMLEAVAERLGALVSGWLRVGFCQGNFNSDNCLVGGRTMDYGPFGWMDKYDPVFAKWTGSGEHYAFMNQPGAAIANYHTLVTSMAPLLGSDAESRLVALVRAGAEKINRAASETFHVKLGFETPGSEAAASLWKDLDPLLEKSNIDYTVFWRQLAAVAELSAASDEALVAPLKMAFYQEPSSGLLKEWASWLRQWLAAVVDDGDAAAVAARLRAVNPKYVPREWMLAEAYSAASQGDYSVVHELHALFQRPYDEQPDMEAKYFRCAPKEALTKGGLAFMS